MISQKLMQFPEVKRHQAWKLEDIAYRRGCGRSAARQGRGSTAAAARQGPGGAVKQRGVYAASRAPLKRPWVMAGTARGCGTSLDLLRSLPRVSLANLKPSPNSRKRVNAWRRCGECRGRVTLAMDACGRLAPFRVRPVLRMLSRRRVHTRELQTIHPKLRLN